MSNSSLVNYTKISPNKTIKRNHYYAVQELVNKMLAG